MGLIRLKKFIAKSKEQCHTFSLYQTLLPSISLAQAFSFEKLNLDDVLIKEQKRKTNFEIPFGFQYHLNESIIGSTTGMG